MTVRDFISAGHAHYRAGRVAEAAAAYRQALALAPGHPAALHYTGVMEFHAGRLDAAIDLVQRSVTAAPHKSSYHANLGLVLYTAGRFEEAATAQRAAIALHGEAPRNDAFNSLGTTLLALERMREAIDAYRKEVALHPSNAAAWSNLGAALAETGRLEEALACYRRAVELDRSDSLTHGNLLMLLHFDPAADPVRIREEHRAWATRHAMPLAKEIRPHANDRTPGRRLRVGYVSPDLRGHVVGYSLLPILSNHDRARFEIVCYSDCPRPDGVTEALRERVSHWRVTGRLSDAGLADLVRDDRVDILVDLTLHMSGNRMLTFARKPAPVQLTYLGYAASTGLAAMDYRISDAHMDPPGATTDDPEQLLRLPDCYWAYRPPEAAAALPVTPPPVLRNRFVTFGSFNNFRKVNPATITAWARLLSALPNSKLLIVLNGGEDNAHVPAMFGRHGVDPTRVRLLPRQPMDGYFRLHSEVDISLDPYPYNGGITTLNALWMGVPTVTLAGGRAVARAGLSILRNVDLDALVARTEEEYVAVLVRLAKDVDRLASLRATLRDTLRASPLMNERQFTANLESLYLAAWEQWRGG